MNVKRANRAMIGINSSLQKMTRVYLSLGSNLGDRRTNLAAALLEISRLPRTRIGKMSSIYRTGPVLPRDSLPQPDYFNQAAGIETGLAPLVLLGRLMEIEKKLGRVRGRKNAPRTIDIDIIYYGSKILKSKDLVIPHPRAAGRRFVLKPLCELDPRILDPVQNRTVAEFLESAPAGQKIRKLPKGKVSKYNENKALHP